jgi:RecA-family ATPase
MTDKLTIRTIAEIEEQPTEFLWEPYIPTKALTIVNGNPGDGKSTLMLAITAALTNGQPLPGQSSRNTANNVIYQTAEDSYNSTVKP